MKKVIILLCAMLVGCITAVAPQGMKIKTTEDPAEVENCQVVGAVEAHPPYIWPGDDLKQLKNKAVLLGADTIFVTSRFGNVFGMAYACNRPANLTNKPIQSEKQPDIYTELIKLKELQNKGILTQEEFEQQKSKLLNP